MPADESFWDYSCRVYAHPGISEMCLYLQNKHGLDVNLLLFAAWFGKTRGVLEDSILEEAVDFSQSWASEVVRPLRRARNWLKKKVADEATLPASERESMQALRTQIKTLELRTEQYQQTHLEAIASVPRQTQTHEAWLDAMSTNLQRVASANAELSATLQESLNALCSALANA